MDSTVITVNSTTALHYSHTQWGMDYFGVSLNGTIAPKLMDVVEGSTDEQVISEFFARLTIPVVVPSLVAAV
jgi:hypothetical protein